MEVSFYNKISNKIVTLNHVRKIISNSYEIQIYYGLNSMSTFKIDDISFNWLHKKTGMGN